MLEKNNEISALGLFFYKQNYNTFTNKLLLVKQELSFNPNIWILVYIDFVNNTFEYGFLQDGIETISRTEIYTKEDLIARIANTTQDLEFNEAIDFISNLEIYNY